MAGRVIGRIIPPLGGTSPNVVDNLILEDNDTLTFGTDAESVLSPDGTDTNWDIDSGTLAFRNVSNQIALSINPQASSSIQELLLVSDAGILSTASAVRIYSNNPSTASRNLITLTNDNTLATGTVCLNIQQDASADGVTVTKSAAGGALRVNLNGAGTIGLNLTGTATTTGQGIQIPTLDSLTTGQAIRVLSNSPSSASRNLILISNGNLLSSNTRIVRFNQQSDSENIFLTNTQNGNAILIENQASTNAVILVSQSTQNSGIIFNVPNADSLTSGGIVNAVSNSSDASVRQLVNIQNSHSAANGAYGLKVSQLASQDAVIINHTGGTGYSLRANHSGNATTRVSGIGIIVSNSGSGGIVGIDGLNITSGSPFLAANIGAIGTAGAVTGQIQIMDASGAIHYIVTRAAGS